MWGQSSSNDVPAKYRMGLALSTAFLIHTLAFSGLPSPIPDTQEPQHSIHFELLTPGTRASMPKAAKAPGEVVETTIKTRNPSAEISSDQVEQPSLPQITTRLSDQEVSKHRATLKKKPQKSEADHQSLRSLVKPIPSESRLTQPAAASSAEHQAVVPNEHEEHRPTRITQSPSERDPYLIKLAIHLGKELEKLRVPAISKLDQKLTMDIELQLLGNGALTRTRVLKSTGIKKIDDAAYRASLAASPYPEPPSDDNQSHFEIELVFSPKRL